MKKLLSFAIATSMIFVMNMVGFATPKKGVQTILLHRWGTASTTKLIDTLKRYSGSEIEISFAPNVGAIASDPYKNIRTIIDGLTDKKVYVAVYLSFHATDGSVNGLDAFKTFYDEYKGKAQIIVCPSLEDRAKVSEIDLAAKTIATKIGGNNIGSLILRRSPDPFPPNPKDADSSKPSRSVVINGKTYNYKAIELEVHGVINSTIGSNVYSNDGVFVYNPNMVLYGTTKESSGSFKSINTTTTYSVSDFTSKSNPYRTNLWRPAYNMFRGCDGKYLSKDSRNFSDCNSKAFDDEEAKALKAFLGIP